MDLDCLSPMYDAKTSHYYVNEIARLKNGEYIIPIRWVLFRGKVYADAFSVIINEEVCLPLTFPFQILFILQNVATVLDGATKLICTDDLSNNYLDLQDRHKIPKWSGM